MLKVFVDVKYLRGNGNTIADVFWDVFFFVGFYLMKCSVTGYTFYVYIQKMYRKVSIDYITEMKCCFQLSNALSNGFFFSLFVVDGQRYSNPTLAGDHIYI